MQNLSRKAGAFLLAGLISFAVTAYGQGIWGLLASANLRFHPEAPWSAVVMAALLVGLVLYLGGRGWPHSNAEARRRLLRWNPMPFGVFAWAVLAGALAIGAFGGLWIVVSDLVRIPPGLTPSMTGVPLATGLGLLALGSTAAPITEEAAFRGYAQGLLEQRWGRGAAPVIGSSLLFAAAHFTQGLDPAKLSLYFAAGVIFGTIAYLTNSLYAAMMAHAFGDVLGFTVLWPHDRAHALIWQGGVDSLFWPAIAALALLAPLSLAAFLRLAAMTRGARPPAGALAPA
jgi:membrane protease YdiL (CAAX protease family)